MAFYSSGYMYLSMIQLYMYASPVTRYVCFDLHHKILPGPTGLLHVATASAPVDRHDDVTAERAHLRADHAARTVVGPSRRLPARLLRTSATNRATHAAPLLNSHTDTNKFCWKMFWKLLSLQNVFCCFSIKSIIEYKSCFIFLNMLLAQKWQYNVHMLTADV